MLVVSFVLLIGCISEKNQDKQLQVTPPTIVIPTESENPDVTQLPAPTVIENPREVTPNLPSIRSSATPTATHTQTLPIGPMPSEIPSSTPTTQPEMKAQTLSEKGLVVSVVDGDTIKANVSGRIQTIRYIGIDAPESKHPSVPVECYAEQADSFNRGLVLDKTVRLEKDVSETDRYGRLLRYVWLDNEMVNELLVKKGFAIAYPYPPDTKYQIRLSSAEQTAKQQGAGLWTTCQTANATPTMVPSTAPTINPSATPSQIPTATPISSAAPTVTPTLNQSPAPTATSTPQPACDSSYPDVCIPVYPPDLDCGEISFKNFRVLQPDPHRFDGDKDGIGCES